MSTKMTNGLREAVRARLIEAHAQTPVPGPRLDAIAFAIALSEAQVTDKGRANLGFDRRSWSADELDAFRRQAACVLAVLDLLDTETDGSAEVALCAHDSRPATESAMKKPHFFG